MGARGGLGRRGESRPDGPQREPEVPLPLPKDVRAAWQAARTRPELNAGLVFDRFVAAGSGGGAKKVAWDGVLAAAKRSDTKLAQASLGRWRATVARAGGQPFALRTDWRLVAGLGRGGPLEVGFAFDRYGFPVLPGSGVKGLARAWGLRQVAKAAGSKDLGKVDEALSGAAELEKEWGKQLGEVAMPPVAGEFRAIFGTTAGAGGAVFFDGVPAKPPKLELDIMNPHYPRYYRGDGPPSDDQNPVPVYFLTVAADSEFLFAVGWRGGADEKAVRLRALAEEWLRQGLQHLGAGAKTSAGYGYFV